MVMEEEVSEEEDEGEEEENGGVAVVGRGGRRSAKVSRVRCNVAGGELRRGQGLLTLQTKAKKAVTRKTKRAAAVAAPKKTTRRGASVTTQSDSDLTEMSDEE